MEEDAQLIPSGMTNDCIAQTWYRFLRTIGSPIALCSPQVISKTPQFMQWVVSRADGVEAFHHPCLMQLPHVFLKAIKGISSQVDAFLGMKYGPLQKITFSLKKIQNNCKNDSFLVFFQLLNTLTNTKWHFK